MNATDEARQRIDAWARSVGANGQAPTMLDMVMLLESEAQLRKENAALKEALKRARSLALRPSACGFTMRQFAAEIGITPTQLSEWTSDIPEWQCRGLSMAAQEVRDIVETKVKLVFEPDFMD